MKLPLSWLKEFVKVDISAEELADRLTMTGQEVESVETDVIFEGVVIGEVIERFKHPNADKLNVAKVRVGKDSLQIVCGAPNLNVGQKVPVALVGAKLGDFEIKKVELRGVESHGMICSERELGLGENHDGIMVLEKKAEVGSNFSDYLGKEKILDIKVQANRPDCMGMIGLARETAATLNKKFVQSEIKISENAKEKTLGLVEIQVLDKDLCPRYAARVVKNVKISESPNWLKRRLLSMGVRPINNLVDVSNYVMLETGQPMHFFDLNKVKSGEKAKIIVRRAKKSEEIVTLDGQKRKLTEAMLVIADEKKAIALAGVMGGENTEVDENTTDILIEAAVFDKANIRRTSRALGLRSEAVARFEKGIAYELPVNSIDRAAELLAELAGGEIAQGMVDVRAKEPKTTEIELDITKLNAFLGVEVSVKEIETIFDRLGFGIKKIPSRTPGMTVVVPWWRADIKMNADLYEEVVRFWGYNKLPSTLPKTIADRVAENRNYETTKKIREVLSAIGLTEVITYSFIGQKELEAIGERVENAPKVANPLVSEQEYMRTSLVPHMLMALRDNQFNKDEISFFEIGKTFKIVKGQKLPKETRSLSFGIIGGKSWPISYKEGGNYYQLKGIISRLLYSFNFSLYNFTPSEDSIYSVGQAAKIIINGQEIGSLGIVNKNILNKFDLKKQVAIGIVDLDVLEKLGTNLYCFKDFSKFPKVVRDISAIFPKSVNVSDIVGSISRINKLLTKTEIVDIYEGRPLEKDKKSVTIRLEFSSFERTLTEKEVDEIMKICQDKLGKMGGEIRGANS